MTVIIISLDDHSKKFNFLPQDVSFFVDDGSELSFIRSSHKPVYSNKKVTTRKGWSFSRIIIVKRASHKFVKCYFGGQKCPHSYNISYIASKVVALCLAHKVAINSTKF